MEATYKEKFALLEELIPSIVESIKKDLKNEHLKQDIPFARKYLQGKNLNKVDVADLSQAYGLAIKSEEQGETIAEFMANRWILKKSDLYYFFETKLSQINPDFTSITEIDEAKGSALVQEVIEAHGAVDAYIFAVLNSVAFKEKQFQTLKQAAEEELKCVSESQKVEQEKETGEALIRKHQIELSRMEDKYEKKLLGLQRKYLTDVEALKKQIATLHKKLANDLK